jgi:diadenosine tetraphosphate (Ap4A) HIT family hydrolase
VSEGCLSCAIVGGAEPVEGGNIAETIHFHAHQDVAYPVPGLVIVASKRHMKCLDELTVSEAQDLSSLLLRVRRAQRGALGIEHVYYFYNEDTSHHFHVWMVPRYTWMKQFGKSIQSVRPSLLHAREVLNGPDGKMAVREAVERLQIALRQNDAP